MKALKNHLWISAGIVTLFFGILLYSYSPLTSEVTKGFILQNDFVRFEFEPEHMGLNAIIDKTTWINHIQPVPKSHLLWEILIKRGTQENPLNNNDAQCTSSHIENLSDGSQRAILEWTDVDWWREKKAISVTVTIDLPKDCGIATWRISVENKSTFWGIWSVKFPYVNGFLKANSYDVAKPFNNTGYLYPKCNERVGGDYPSGGWSMQFISINVEDNGLYWAALDPWSQRKDFVVIPGSSGYFLNYTEEMGVPGSDYPDFYPIAFGVHRGGWLEASKIYRKWALKQVWTEKGLMSQRTSTPDMVKNIGLWMQSGWSFGVEKGTPDEMNQPFYKALDYTGVPMAIHWYNWHHMPFDNEYPHFFPPKDGFRERVKGLVARGILVMPYINGMIADYDNPDMDKFLPYAVKDGAGGLNMNIWGTSSGRTIYMCPYNDFWQNQIVTLVDSLTDYFGVNGVYIDMIGAASPRFCFDKSHGHPLGGGRWWIDSYRNMLEKVQVVAHSKGRNAVITTENTAEPWMNKLDAFLSWIKPDEREVPMNQAVYSGYTYYFGSPSWLHTSTRSFVMAQGRAFIWGQQNGWMGFGLFSPENQEKGAYFKRIGQYRVAARKFLSFGELLGPVKSLKPLSTITELWPTHRGDPKNGTLPTAMASLWRAEDGNLGIFIVNFLDERQAFSYSFNASDFGLKPAANQQYKITEIKPEGNQPVGLHYAGPIIRNEELEPRGIKVLEIAVENK